MERELYAEVIVSISHRDVDRPFTYRAPKRYAAMIDIGQRVLVPFGRGNKPREGYILNILNKDQLSFDEAKIKDILSIPDEDGASMFNRDIIKLALWMKDKYYTTMAECLKCIMPAGVQIKNDFAYQAILDDVDIKGRPRQVFDYIRSFSAPIPLKELAGHFGPGVRDAIKKLLQAGAIVEVILSKSSDYVIKKRVVSLNTDVEKLPELNAIKSKESKQSAVLNLLLEKGKTEYNDIKKILAISDSPIQSLLKKGLIVIEEMEHRRITARGVREESHLKFTAEQAAAIEELTMHIGRKQPKPALIHGVTGSGKTEVYLELIDNVLGHGKQAIVLVPEISLTPQTVERFYARFGNEIAVTHSKLSNGERYDQWKNARDGHISVMIGPRSAIFTPFRNLGIIVIDEEHETTYKSETTPKYDAREVAIKRSELTGAAVVLGSATPSIDSYYKTQTGSYRLINMKDRVNSSFPAVSIVDMRQELEMGNRSIFSASLHEAIQSNLDKGQQTILFLNRRGHSTFVSCRKCGFVLKCEDCNINFTYHLYTDKLICHYCGKEAQNPRNCPQCGSKYIKYFGVGTQKIEDEVKSLFPSAAVLRMDMDTTGRKNSHGDILNRFKSGEAQILIGTQMIAKGLDFPNVTLVGVVAADISLNMGDFRSGETTFQLLTQVSGRAGRADLKGKVIIQTYNPDHYAIRFAKDVNYEDYYQHEIALRRQMDYPPYTHIFVSLFTGESEKKIITSLFKLLDIMNHYNKSGDFEMLGPAPAQISKIKKRYRWKLTVKCKDEKRLIGFMFYCLDKLKAIEDLSDININMTLNPGVNL